ncbi:hypothetical protein Poli38472_008868 [Pythium oligandrum]|uniref:Thymidylate kinase n=1 Tax=Pythium oligandrum TaxID=41045 RepID=A0A8K1FAG4_PYTOL|nr:hypothetical protein Poli38472_008868 [Pythium oligandrum]|eukprot:TMW56220.1 hypothetical protein Poli38472_008868 [Pythium oligandrum]
MLKMTRRGVFVLFEGVDRCGKTTQTKLLQETLQQSGRASSLLHFPDRSTAIGQSINAYLTTTQAMDDRAIHLLFAANRWEAAGKIEDLLKSGVNIVMDRYSFSGVAFSAAKPGMTIDWCWQPEVGLPKPDTVIFLDIPVEKASKRADFGQERYETTAFQEQVYKNFYEIMASETPAWHVLDATETIEQVHARVLALTEQCIEANATKPLTYFQKRA